ncbi:MAG: FecR family protein [Cytophagales bacterium]|nr:FecR family protein [Cytophagales bacterium]
MKKKELDNLLQKFENGDCTPEEIIFLEGVVSDSINNNSKLTFLKDENEIQSEEGRMWKKLNDELFNKPQRRHFTSQRIFVQLAIAASLLIVASFSIYLYFPEFFRQNMILENRGLETKNNANTNQTLTLPDGSKVVLEKNSSIIVSEDFGKVNRTVLLKGKAFFKVVRNEKKPFLVRMGNLVTEVLGTSFKVGSDNQNKSIEVAVISGKVSVYANSKNGISKKLNGVVLTSNLKAIYNTENQTIQESIVETPQLLLPNLNKSDFIFDEIQFGDLRDRLKLFYGVDIIFVNREIEKCLFTGDLRGLDLFGQLDVACTSINAKYELRGATIFINGKSCK